MFKRRYHLKPVTAPRSKASYRSNQRSRHAGRGKARRAAVRATG